MRILKEVTEPQTIIICDAYLDDRDPDVMINDDECGFNIRKSNGEFTSVDSFGFIYIFTKEEFLNYIESKDEDEKEEQDDFDLYVIIKDFVGTVGVTAKEFGGKENDNWKLNDYFHHQDINGGLILDVSGDYDFNALHLDEALRFLNSDEKNQKLNTPIESIEGKLIRFEKLIESQRKEIAKLADAIQWCERNIK